MCKFCDVSSNNDEYDGIDALIDLLKRYPEYCPLCGKPLLCDDDDADTPKIYFVPDDRISGQDCFIEGTVFHCKDDIASSTSLLHQNEWDNYDMMYGLGDSHTFDVYEAKLIGTVTAKMDVTLSFDSNQKR